MKKVYKLSELGKLSLVEFTVFFIGFCGVPSSLLISNDIFRITVLVILTLIFLCLLIFSKKFRGERNLPKHYILMLILLLFTSTLITLLLSVGDSNFVIYGFVLVFLLTYLLLESLCICYLILFSSLV
ncbi:hypothetical protein [Sporosarcina sp. OR05]|uniref:hypothetical protein n=1 Tax=Sporosarcina sp. OR05 TaxID=2969819 RepID=UPI00352A4C0A